MSYKCTGHHENENYGKKYKTFFPSDFIRVAGLYGLKISLLIITHLHPHSPEDLSDIRFVMHPYGLLSKSQPKMKNLVKKLPKTKPPPLQKKKKETNVTSNHVLHLFSFR